MLGEIWLWKKNDWLLRGCNLHDKSEWVWYPRTEPYSYPVASQAG